MVFNHYECRIQVGRHRTDYMVVYAVASLNGSTGSHRYHRGRYTSCVYGVHPDLSHYNLTIFELL